MTIPLPPSSGPTEGATAPIEGPGALPADEEGKGLSLWRGAWRRLRRNPTAMIGAAIILVFVVIAIIAPLLTPYEPA